MNEKKEILNYKYLIVLAVAVPIIFGISYAYFLASVEYTDGKKTQVSGNATSNFIIDLNTQNEGYINANNLVPITNEMIQTHGAKGIFSVDTIDETGNTNDYYINYNINLTEIKISNNLCVEDFKWRLYKNEEGTTELKSAGTFENIKSSGDTEEIQSDGSKLLIISNPLKLTSDLTGVTINKENSETETKTGISIGANATHNYELIIYIEESFGDQLALLNGTFKAKVSIDAELTNVRV